MFTVKELAERYDVTKKTMYKHIKHEDIQPYLFTDERGLKLMPEGLDLLNVIMANNSIKKPIETTTPDINENLHQVVNAEYINALKEQIEELKKDKDELRQDKEKLYIELQEQRQLMLSGKCNMSEKKGFFRWFSK
jgi:SMC interacting uncharacterized protein involved in chromosome segregation